MLGIDDKLPAFEVTGVKPGFASHEFADIKGTLTGSLGVRSQSGVPYRCTFLVDPNQVLQHVYANNLSVGRYPRDTLQVLNARRTQELCACNRPIGGANLRAA